MTIRIERGYARFDNGKVYAEVSVHPGGHLQIMDWRALEERKGHSEAALRELRDEWRIIEVIDATPWALEFWLKMKARGLVDKVRVMGESDEQRTLNG